MRARRAPLCSQRRAVRVYVAPCPSSRSSPAPRLHWGVACANGQRPSPHRCCPSPSLASCPRPPPAMWSPRLWAVLRTGWPGRGRGRRGSLFVSLSQFGLIGAFFAPWSRGAPGPLVRRQVLGPALDLPISGLGLALRYGPCHSLPFSGPRLLGFLHPLACLGCVSVLSAWCRHFRLAA